MTDITLTPEQRELIDSAYQKWERIDRPIDKEKFEWGLARLYKDSGYTLQKVVYQPNPQLTLEAAAAALEEDQPGKHKEEYIQQAYFDTMYTCWTHGRAFFVEAARVANIELNEELAETVTALGEQVGIIIPYDTICFVSENCISYKTVDNELHSLTGPAWSWNEGFDIYCIEGNLVDKQVVMSPHTLRVWQIRDEEDIEVKRIMINQLGWDTYLQQAGAKLVDSKIINVANTTWMENLMYLEDDDIAVLTTYDPSTGRPYSLEVSTSCTDTKQAQEYLLNREAAFSGFKKKPKPDSVYPVMRT